ncbi:MAG: MBL fold metallo-hydrolase [Acidobacteriota bacterium]
MRLTILASGSGGNATVVEAGGVRLLLDCGITYRQLQRRMHACSVRTDELDAVFLSHEHTDHVQGLPVFRRHHTTPVFATEGTASALDEGLAAVPELVSGKAVRLGALAVTPVATRHDAREPIGFVLEADDCRVAVMTDTGEVTSAMVEMIAGCQAVLLEANHDVDLLRYGSYPWPLKQRIASPTGHLSNLQAQLVIEQLCHADLELVVGMHLSRENNRSDLARSEIGKPLAGSSVRVEVADQDRPLVVHVGSRRSDSGQLRLFDDEEPVGAAAGAGRPA